jgi:hypothetical protein
LRRDDEDLFKESSRVIGAGHLAEIVDALTDGAESTAKVINFKAILLFDCCSAIGERAR